MRLRKYLNNSFGKIFCFAFRLLYRNEIMTAATPKAVPVTLLSGFLVGSLTYAALTSLI